MLSEKKAMSEEQHSPPRRLSEALLTALRRKWGERAAWRASEMSPAYAPLPTGYPELDALLGGGLPRGTLSEFLGRTTSGMTTLTFTLLAHAQARGEAVVFVDLGHTFDGEYAAYCGLDLAKLLLVVPERISEALETIQALVATRTIGVIVVDALALLQEREAGRQYLAQTLTVLPRLLARTTCALLALTPQPYSPDLQRGFADDGSVVAHAAALRLQFERVSWLPPDGGQGCQAGVTVLRQRGVDPGQTLITTLPFADHEEIR